MPRRDPVRTAGVSFGYSTPQGEDLEWNHWFTSPWTGGCASGAGFSLSAAKLPAQSFLYTLICIYPCADGFHPQSV
jgi:hypothetical protein